MSLDTGLNKFRIFGWTSFFLRFVGTFDSEEENVDPSSPFSNVSSILRFFEFLSSVLFEPGEASFEQGEALVESDEASFKPDEASFEPDEAPFEAGKASFESDEAPFGAAEACFFLTWIRQLSFCA